MKKLFGTDGIRGLANKYPMTAIMAMKTGKAVASFIKQKGFTSIVIGKDTRISGDMLEAALSAGITSAGVNVFSAGILPTPGVAFLASRMKETGAGIVISASHNPFYDNGIKIFNSMGFKLSDTEEMNLENFILNHDFNDDDQESFTGEQKNDNFSLPCNIGRISNLLSAKKQYADFLRRQFKSELSCSSPGVSRKIPEGEHVTPEKIFKVMIDCANGAASELAPLIFKEPAFDAEFIFNTPDGRNINENCGSQHTEALGKQVLKKKADIGLAFDGDADRLIALDENAETITGDKILAICAKHAKNQGRLDNNIVVSTIMSNIGLTKALESLKIDHVKTDVGDREVLKKMEETGAVMGGEDSGHMIFSRCHTTGDGILTALQLISVMAETGQSLSELATIMTVFPQILMNVPVDESKPDFMKIKEIADEIKTIENDLENKGRVLVRYSGTQPLLRVMVEGPNRKITQEYCKRICRKIELSPIMNPVKPVM